MKKQLKVGVIMISGMKKMYAERSKAGKIFD